MKQKIRQWFNKYDLSKQDLLGLVEENNKITKQDLKNLLIKRASIPEWNKYFTDVAKDLL